MTIMIAQSNNASPAVKRLTFNSVDTHWTRSCDSITLYDIEELDAIPFYAMEAAVSTYNSFKLTKGESWFGLGIYPRSVDKARCNSDRQMLVSEEQTRMIAKVIQTLGKSAAAQSSFMLVSLQTL